MSNDEYPSRRFVRIKLTGKNQHQYTMTFLTADQANTNDPMDNAIVQHVAATMPAKKEYVVQLLGYLQANEARFFDWLEASPQNTLLFAQDPLKALSIALPDSPPPQG